MSPCSECAEYQELKRINADMLEALRIVRAHVSPALQPHIYELMDSAIAKATEQS